MKRNSSRSKLHFILGAIIIGYYLFGLYLTSVPLNFKYSSKYSALAGKFFVNFLHVPLYGGLTFLLVLFSEIKNFTIPKTSWKYYSIVFALAFSFAIFDEYHQIGGPRDSSLGDLFLDGVGIILVLGGTYLWSQRNEGNGKAVFRKILKWTLSVLVYYSGIFSIARFYNNLRGGKVTILMYHRISRDNLNSSSGLPFLFSSQKNFERQIRFLLRKYRIISLNDFLSGVEGNGNLPKNSLLITFDDGYKDIYENAYPILKKYRIPATIFLTSSYIGSKGIFWWDKLYWICNNLALKNNNLDLNFPENYPEEIKEKLSQINFSQKRDEKILSLISGLKKYSNHEIETICEDLYVKTKATNFSLAEFNSNNTMLRWEEIREMKKNGISFGAHTRTHPCLTHISKEEAKKEIAQSKVEIEKELGGEIAAFTYPGGGFSEEIKQMVFDSGYKCALTILAGLNGKDDDIFSLKRINIWDGAVTGLWGRFSQSLFALQLVRYF